MKQKSDGERIFFAAVVAGGEKFKGIWAVW
jgi:hypothetical protein